MVDMTPKNIGGTCSAKAAPPAKDPEQDKEEVKTARPGPPADTAALLRRVLWLNARVFGLSAGLVLGLGLFVATNWLVLKGGNPVGPHLRLLGQYFLGYSVTFTGSLVGFVYAFILGYACGALVALVYNRIAGIRNRGRMG